MPASTTLQHLTHTDVVKYSINLMWINSKKSSGLTIASNKDAGSFGREIIQPVIKWAKANPEAKVYLWYDSMHTTGEAVTNSREILERALAENGVSNAELRDIREIPGVKNNPDIFTPMIPIYFRVDILKLLIILDSVERDKCDAAVFSDLEVGDKRPSRDRMSKQELFNSEVCDFFRTTGLVMGEDEFKGKTENQFIQLYRNPHMLDALRLNINTNFNRVMRYLARHDSEARKQVGKLNEMVYATMNLEISGFYAALTKNAKIKWKEINKRPPLPNEEKLMRILIGSTNRSEIEAAGKPLAQAQTKWEEVEYNVARMKNYSYSDDGYEPWGAFDGGYGRCLVKYYLDGETMPMEVGRIPSREVQCRRGWGHGEISVERTALVEPSNGANYCCTFLPYQTDEARRLLKLHERRFSAQTSPASMFSAEPRSNSASASAQSLDQIIGELNNFKNRKITESDPVNTDRYLGAMELHTKLVEYQKGFIDSVKLKKYIKDELEIPSYSKMFESGSESSDDLKKYFENAFNLVALSSEPKM